jgi:hypothetical protein
MNRLLKSADCSDMTDPLYYQAGTRLYRHALFLAHKRLEDTQKDLWTG